MTKLLSITLSAVTATLFVVISSIQATVPDCNNPCPDVLINGTDVIGKATSLAAQHCGGSSSVSNNKFTCTNRNWYNTDAECICKAGSPTMVKQERTSTKCPEVVKPTATGEQQTCKIFKQECEKNGDATLAKADVKNGVGTYSCSNCDGGKVTGGIAPPAKSPPPADVDLAKIPGFVYGILLGSMVVVIVLGFAVKKRSGSRDFPYHPKKSKVTKEKLKGFVQMVSNFYIFSIDSGNFIRHASFKAYIIEANSFLAYRYGNFMVLSKSLRLSSIIFNLCLNMAMCIAFGSAQIGTPTTTYYASCEYADNGAGSSSSSEQTNIDSDDATSGARVSFSPMMSIFVKVVSAGFGFGVNSMLNGAHASRYADKVSTTGGSACMNRFIKEFSRFFVILLGIALVVGAVALLTVQTRENTANADKGGTENNEKITALVLSFLTSSFLFSLVVSGLIMPIVKWFTASAIFGTEGDINLVSKPSDIEATVTDTTDPRGLRSSRNSWKGDI